jgi:predicted alpha/beta superfamily hydrolase
MLYPLSYGGVAQIVATCPAMHPWPRDVPGPAVGMILNPTDPAMPSFVSRLALLATIAAIAACATPDAPCDASSTQTVVPYIVPRTEVRTMRSGTGIEYRILVARPATPPPATGYPVLYLLDGDDSFAIASATAERLARQGDRGGIQPGLVVGIGYPGPSRRAIDYTPATAKPATGPDGLVVESGGAQAFRDFIAKELQPAIARSYRVNPDRQALMGHSYGGLFVLDNSRELARRLEALADTGLTVRFRVLAGEDHGSASLPAIGAAVRHAFAR